MTPRRVWRYQRGNQNRKIKEVQAKHWPKEKVNKYKHRSTIHTQEKHTLDLVAFVSATEVCPEIHWTGHNPSIAYELWSHHVRILMAVARNQPTETSSTSLHEGRELCIMLYNATFSNISAISWLSFYLVEEIGEHR